MNRYIDINCDVGEGIGNESDLFPMISSCNIACGGHAGSKETIRTCLRLAQKYKVNIGAHPSYPDRENFGRISMDMPEREFIESVQGQMELFLNECDSLGVSLHHIKPHGALYNDIAKDTSKAQLFLTAINPYKANVFLYVPFGSVIEELALTQNFEVKREAFADRNYNADLSLVSRKQKNALLTKAKDVLDHVLLMFDENMVKSIDGQKIPLMADTYCIHGDTPSAFQILTYITERFANLNIQFKL
ncbi:5-oxoprolinase subunit PxpA [Maribacter sp. X9]|uniref:5-oxoprolinase subunit PxpA n=1 Tax=Maribacter sp. X9 TaxID=3402159 RepID=UPI003AF37726